MTCTASSVNAVKTYLKSHHMLAYDHWIEGCVDYFKDTNNEEELQRITVEQWMLHDLCEICPGSLPPNLKSLSKTVLNGHYILQINTAIDISVPAYQQYLKLQKADVGNITATMKPDEKISSKRMLKFEMTDGKQTVAGIEYDTINKLTSDVVPGCKMLVKGPVVCRQGLLLLSDKAVEFLGGEVEDIVVTHSLAAQLASKLNLPRIEHIHLTGADDTATTTQSNGQGGNGSDIFNTEVQSLPQQQQRQHPPAAPHRQRQQHPPPAPQQQRQQHPPPAPQQQRQQHQPPAPQQRRQYQPPPAPHQQRQLQQQIAEANSNPVNNNQFDELTQEIFGKRHLETDIEAKKTEKRMRIEAAEVDRSNEFPDDEEFAELMSEELETQFMLNYCEDITESGPVELDTKPFVYIKQINELSNAEKEGKVFRVKAQILQFLTKLKIIDEWKLKCTITDGTGCMDVEVSSDILTGYLGLTPQDISEDKKKLATNPELKNEIYTKVNTACKKTSKTLEALYCIVEITMYALPMITRLIDFEQDHVDQLKKRLNSNGL